MSSRNVSFFDASHLLFSVASALTSHNSRIEVVATEDSEEDVLSLETRSCCFRSSSDFVFYDLDEEWMESLGE